MGFIAPKNIYGNSLLGFVPPINELAFGQRSTATLLSSLLVQPPATHRWFFVRRRFNQFLENLKINKVPKETREAQQPLERKWFFPNEGQEVPQEDGPK